MAKSAGIKALNSAKVPLSISMAMKMKSTPLKSWVECSCKVVRRLPELEKAQSAAPANTISKMPNSWVKVKD